MVIPVLFCDDDLVAVNKPVGMATHAPQPDPVHTDVVRCVQTQLKLDYLGVHQRLDRDTSGVLLFTRRAEANAGLAHAFAHHHVQKRYLAVVHGVPIQAQGIINAPVAPFKNGLMQIASLGDKRAQAACTGYAVLCTSLDRRFSLVELKPKTGRTHQLRVHMRHLGHPIVGDGLYYPQQPAPRLMLHAQELMFPHPTLGNMMTITAPAPCIFDRFAQGLGFSMATHDLVALAAERRMPLTLDQATTIYRVFHGASDGITHAMLRNWTVDKIDNVLIASCYDEQVHAIPDELLQALIAYWQPQAIFAKFRPRASSSVQPESVAPNTPVWGVSPEFIDGKETGIIFRMRPADGLSIGLYADMRETRERVQSWVAGRALHILNAFAYTCGFGVAAQLAAPQAKITNLDLSRRSLDWGRENYRLNSLPIHDYDFVFGDVFDWMQRWARQQRSFDMIILDPPSFARNRGKNWSAERDYADLVTIAARLLKPQGLLVACTNHAGIDRRMFRSQVEQGIQASPWAGAIQAIYGASPIDYPTLGGGESHLKIIIARFI